MTPAPFVPLSSRYGLVTGLDLWGMEHWRGRHADHQPTSVHGCPPDPRRACACPGSSGKRQCCEVASAEDLLCDACRDHCWGVTSDHEYVRLIDVYGSSS